MLLNFGLKKLNLAYKGAFINLKSGLNKIRLEKKTSESLRYYNTTKNNSPSNKYTFGYLKILLINNRALGIHLKRNMTTSPVNLKLVKQFENIVQSNQDTRKYRGLLLDNGLKCLLISDPLTDRSAAAVDVHAGYMLDPKEFPGLAHFCEHMLFMGSKKVFLNFNQFFNHFRLFRTALF